MASRACLAPPTQENSLSLFIPGPSLHKGGAGLARAVGLSSGVCGLAPGIALPSLRVFPLISLMGLIKIFLAQLAMEFQ